jgi:hypothetical protein
MANTKIQRWSILLAEYGVKIGYIKGRDNVKADFLSRLRPPIDINILDDTVEPGMSEPMDVDQAGLEVLRFDGISTTDMAQQQQHEFAQELEEVQLGQLGNILLGGLLCSTKLPYVGAEEKPRALLPEMYRTDMRRAHEEVGHSLAARTLSRIREVYVWPGMRKEVFAYVTNCVTCQSHSKTREHVSMGEAYSCSSRSGHCSRSDWTFRL